MKISPSVIADPIYWWLQFIYLWIGFFIISVKQARLCNFFQKNNFWGSSNFNFPQEIKGWGDQGHTLLHLYSLRRLNTITKWSTTRAPWKSEKIVLWIRFYHSAAALIPLTLLPTVYNLPRDESRPRKSPDYQRGNYHCFEFPDQGHRQEWGDYYSSP